MENTIEIQMTGNMISDKIKKLVKNTNSGLYERSEVVRLTYLALLSGESIFLLGPPGTAKSLLSRKLKNIISNGKAFEYLMNPNTRQEELFGPIAISQLKNDKFVRVVDGYIPDCDIVFLDEIWKSESSILNSLLTIINEKIYKNGKEILNVPMKLLIAASNELPEEGVGLEALYDRFIIRYYVNNTTTKSSFESVILGSELPRININIEKLTTEELIKFKKDAQKVNVPKEILNFIHDIKSRVAEYSPNEEEEYTPPYISDRRWKKIVKLLRTSALADGRNEVGIMDLLILPHVIWDTLPQKEVTKKIFEELWSQYSVSAWWFNLTKEIKSVHYTVMNAGTRAEHVKAKLLNWKGETRVFGKYEIKPDIHGSLFRGYKYMWLEMTDTWKNVIAREGGITRYEVVGADMKARQVSTLDYYLSRGNQQPNAMKSDLYNVEHITEGMTFNIHTVHERMARTFTARYATKDVVNVPESVKDKVWSLSSKFDELEKYTMVNKEPKLNPVLVDNYKNSYRKMITRFNRDKIKVKQLLDEVKEKLNISWL